MVDSIMGLHFPPGISFALLNMVESTSPLETYPIDRLAGVISFT